MKNFLTLAITIISFSLFGQFPNSLSPSDKVYGLSKFWQEVNYNFVYLDKVEKAEWDNTYKEYIARVQATKNDYEYYRELQKFCALLKDGHTLIRMPNDKAFETMTDMFGDYRIFLQNIEGKAIVVKVNQSKKDLVPVGSEVIEVNDLSTDLYLKTEVIPYLSSSTDYILKDVGIQQLLAGLQGQKYKVKIRKPSGELFTLNLTHSQSSEVELYPSSERKNELLEFKWMDKGIAYLALNSFMSDKLDTLFTEILPELYNAKGLIIDIRNNMGGNTSVGRNVLQYLTNDKLLFGSSSSTRIHNATYKAWGRFTKLSDTINNENAKDVYLNYIGEKMYFFPCDTFKIQITARRIVVPTAILIGHSTASAAEDFLIYADNQKHMTKIGENSYGSTGQPLMFELPGGGLAMVCTKKDTYPDGREFVGYGIKPDIRVEKTLKDYLDNKDPVLEEAVITLSKILKL